MGLSPNIACFGDDFQQLALIANGFSEFGLSDLVLSVPILRAKDGLGWLPV